MNTCVQGIDEDRRILAVSKCLEDALEAALRNALELALKIAMTEVRSEMSGIRYMKASKRTSPLNYDYRTSMLNMTTQNLQIRAGSNQRGACVKRRSLMVTIMAIMNMEDTSDPEKKFKTDHTQHTDNIQLVDPSDQDPSLSELVFEQVKVENEKAEPEDHRPSIDTSEISWSSSGCVSSLSAPFDGLNQSVDKTYLIQSTQNCREL